MELTNSIIERKDQDRDKTMRFRQIHLDFHTSEHIPGIGQDFDANEFAAALKAAAVDSITCFSRCHHGLIYHDTRFEARHPFLTRNLLAEQIEACHRQGIRVPIYITVGLDEFMAARHPEWIELDKDGNRSGAPPLQAGWRKMCFNSPYIDYVVAQTEEVLDVFGSEVDGLFFDIISQGECCCRYCMEGMVRKGLDPESQDDRRKHGALVIDAFKSRMTDAIRRKDRDCGIFYNAGHVGPYIRPSLSHYTHLELESLPSGGWGYEHFPVTVRYARNLGLEFIGMTGKFLKSWADFGGMKNPAALEYECFTALALGGGCSVGDQLHPTGKITKATYDMIGGVYRQVAEKEPWCINAKAVTDIGIITPEMVAGGGPFDLSNTSSGVHRMLNELHYQYDFIDFEMDLSKYKLVILPDIIRLTGEQASVVNDYLAKGGKILVSYESGMGETGSEFIIDDMPASVVGDAPFSPDFLVAEDAIGQGVPETEHVMYERGFELKQAPGSKVLANVWKPYFERNYKHFCSHFHTPVEGPAGYPGIVANGNIVYIGYPIFGMYKRHGARVYRDFVINALKTLLPESDRIINTNAPATADIALNYQPDEDRYVLHVLHYIPERRYAAMDTIEEVIPIRDIELQLALPSGYDKVRLVPNGGPIESSRTDGRVHFTIPEVRGHAMVEIGD